MCDCRVKGKQCICTQVETFIMQTDANWLSWSNHTTPSLKTHRTVCLPPANKQTQTDNLRCSAHTRTHAHAHVHSHTDTRCVQVMALICSFCQCLFRASVKESIARKRKKSKQRLLVSGFTAQHKLLWEQSRKAWTHRGMF